jgi:hypothetical protein
MGRDKITLHHLEVQEEDVQQQLHLTEERVEQRSLLMVELGLVELPQLLAMGEMETLLPLAQYHRS